MDSNLFFKKLENQFTNKLPFVAYKKPNENTLFSLLQNTEALHILRDFTSSGFVLAPFDSSNDTVIIPLEDSECIQSDYHKSNNVDVNSLEKGELYDSNQRDHHIQLVSKGINTIKEGHFEKVVLSRVDMVKLQENNPIELFKRLLDNYSQAFVYCWFHPKVGLWLGATPETLIKISNNYFETMSLAGTLQSQVNLAQWSVKEKNEQQIVTDYIVSQLQDSTAALHVSDPKTVQAGNLVHLKSLIYGTLKSNNLEHIVNALHPTPAVCGFPKEPAKQFILKEEGYDREFYTGYLGELNFKEQISRNRNRQNIENNAYSAIRNVSNLFVNLRCMQLKNNEALIYVGGGITGDSEPEREWQETVSKSMTIKKALY
ncbi:isochorismate synthase [Hanstruepera neustonica]|uniref:Isochorismate synthase n=1 Tax=Hanstruepera neustonica TaxID=1445657 RepID=A0A2K1DY25_9FLAO|nr:chorismate-binding protein [Hanstruepera neustonica]PNQ72929.1 isochorismate synthase [Hanstruepera neustonica]